MRANQSIGMLSISSNFVLIIFSRFLNRSKCWRVIPVNIQIFGLTISQIAFISQGMNAPISTINISILSSSFPSITSLTQRGVFLFPSVVRTLNFSLRRL